jgi:hypothetical protein
MPKKFPTCFPVTFNIDITLSPDAMVSCSS